MGVISSESSVVRTGKCTAFACKHCGHVDWRVDPAKLRKLVDG
ncbi:MAG: hypothetical protein V1809_11900 [Planctomycetota bacterium]